MIAAWFVTTFGAKYARIAMWTLGAFAAFLVLLIAFNVVRWRIAAHQAAQVQQTVKSGNATAAAGAAAVNTVNTRAATETAVTSNVQQTQKDISDAQDLDSIRAAVVRGECGRLSDAARSSDPACVVRKPHS